MTISAFIAAILLAFLQTPNPSQTVAQRAKAMMERAKQVSDIRAASAAAFRLKATFSFTGDDLEQKEGIYTETWISETQWRHEITVGDSRYVQVAGLGKSWITYPEGFPTQAIQLPTVMSLFPPDFTKNDIIAIDERTIGGVAANCAFSKPNHDKSQAAFCFEKKSGALLETSLPERRLRNIVNFECEYGTFHKFGEFYFPAEVVCFEDRHKVMTVNVMELVAGPFSDSSLFERPTGSVEIALCSGKKEAPQLNDTSLTIGVSRVPSVDFNRAVLTSVWLVVDEKGKPQNLRVTHSLSTSTPKNALKMVEAFRWWPGTCDGKAVPMPLTMDIQSSPDSHGK